MYNKPPQLLPHTFLYPSSDATSYDVSLIDRCPFCGHPDCKKIDIRGHTERTICRQIEESCCHGTERQI